MTSLTKKSLGQFYTTNQEYILQGMKIPENVRYVIEPFTGNGDLISFIEKFDHVLKTEYYDIDPKKDFITQKDTLDFPPDYTNKYVITNPPYLARNKSTNKYLFDKYDVNDLYKCLIKELLINKSIGGILIVPLNFWSSIRISDIKLRKLFLSVYDIIKINIFEEQVFNDTSYTVCSFQFEPKTRDINLIQIKVYPSNINITTELNKKNNYMIGGEIYNLPTKKQYKITRLTSKNVEKKNTNIIVKCIDDNKNDKIRLSFVDDENIYVDNTPNQTSRTYATLIIEPEINSDKQQELVFKFNEFLNKHRETYNSLFLTNYRESKDIARKRISFDLVYSITEYILDTL
jgi:hypothetical protein